MVFKREKCIIVTIQDEEVLGRGLIYIYIYIYIYIMHLNSLYFVLDESKHSI